MRLQAECPRCPAPVSTAADSWECPTHDAIVPLWRSGEPCYEAFAEHLLLSRGLPSWLPWPLPAGWQVSDFGCVGGEGREPQASFVSCYGTDDVDGVVEMTVLSEEPGVGLAARCGRVVHTDPGHEAAEDPPLTRVRLESGMAPLWVVSTSDAGGEALDRAVLAGEALGRWLWLVLRPASAALSLPHMPPLVDVSTFGPALVSLPFAKLPRSW
jgi:hypothetical protein